MSLRPVTRVIQSKPTLEGAGVHLRRAFGFGNTTDFDPFLLLDDFRNDVPEDYLAGFPWHPHRGIETITYVLAGTVEHGDSMGNRGAIGAGDVQWMTAGSGIIHQEMPKGDHTGPHARLSVVGQSSVGAEDDRAALSGSEVAEIPEITDDDGTHVRLVCGSFWGKQGSGGRHRRRSDLSSMSRCRRASARRCRSRRRAMPSRTSSREAGNSAMRRGRWRCRRKAWAGWTPRRPPTPTIAR